MSATTDALRAKLLANATIASLATGGVWFGPAGQGATYPMIRCDLLSSPQFPVYGADGYEDLTYAVRAITTGDDTSGPALAEAIDTALNFQPLTITGRTGVQTMRAGRIEYPETVEGVVYYHDGGQYRVTVD